MILNLGVGWSHTEKCFTCVMKIVVHMEIYLCSFVFLIILFYHRFGHTLQSFGVMDTRVNVQASDDVYRNTREKMTLAEEESKKVWYVGLLYVYCTFTVRLLYIYCTFTVRLLYVWCMFGVRLVYTLHCGRQ